MSKFFFNGFCILERKRNDDEEKEAKNKITKQKTEELCISPFDDLPKEIHREILGFVVSVSDKKWKSNWKNAAEVSKIWNEQIWIVFHTEIPITEKQLIFWECCEYVWTNAVKKMLMYKNFNPSDLYDQAIIIAQDPSDFHGDRNNRCLDNDFNKVFHLLLQDNRVDPSAEDNFAIRDTSTNGKTELVKLLLQDNRVDPSARKNEAIINACMYGEIEVIKLLLQDKRADPSDCDNKAIKRASKKGEIEVVALLLKDKRVDPSADDNKAIQNACEGTNDDIVKLLLQDKRVNPAANDNKAIQNACQCNEDDIISVHRVKLLLKDTRVDPSSNDNYAIRSVCGSFADGHVDIFKLLLKDNRFNSAASNNYAILTACS